MTELFDSKKYGFYVALCQVLEPFRQHHQIGRDTEAGKEMPEMQKPEYPDT